MNTKIRTKKRTKLVTVRVKVCSTKFPHKSVARNTKAVFPIGSWSTVDSTPDRDFISYIRKVVGVKKSERERERERDCDRGRERLIEKLRERERERERTCCCVKVEGGGGGSSGLEAEGDCVPWISGHHGQESCTHGGVVGDRAGGG